MQSNVVPFPKAKTNNEDLLTIACSCTDEGIPMAPLMASEPPHQIKAVSCPECGLEIPVIEGCLQARLAN